MHNAAPCRSSVSNTVSCNQLASRSSTTHRNRFGARVRNSSRRSTLRFQRGGSCTTVGPTVWPKSSSRATWFGNHEAASRSFMRCDPNAPSFNAYTKPSGAAAAHALTVVLRWQSVEGVVELDRVEHRGVELEPAPLRDPGRIHDAAPVGIVPAGAADPRGSARQRRHAGRLPRWADPDPCGYQAAPATWRVAAFSRFQRFTFATASTNVASSCSSK